MNPWKDAFMKLTTSIRIMRTNYVIMKRDDSDLSKGGYDAINLIYKISENLTSEAYRLEEEGDAETDAMLCKMAKEYGDSVTTPSGGAVREVGE